MNMYDRIHNLCKDNGTNVTAMCRELSITRSVLSELKSGRTRQLSGPHLAKIASYFEISVENLMGTDGDDADRIPDKLRLIARRLAHSGLEQQERDEICLLLVQIADKSIHMLRQVHRGREETPRASRSMANGAEESFE